MCKVGAGFALTDSRVPQKSRSEPMAGFAVQTPRETGGRRPQRWPYVSEVCILGGGGTPRLVWRAFRVIHILLFLRTLSP